MIATAGRQGEQPLSEQRPWGACGCINGRVGRSQEPRRFSGAAAALLFFLGSGGRGCGDERSMMRAAALIRLDPFLMVCFPVPGCVRFRMGQRLSHPRADLGWAGGRGHGANQPPPRGGVGRCGQS